MEETEKGTGIMGFEFEILDFLQGIRTPVCDAFMCAVSRLGDAGMIWILLTILLLLIPGTRKSGAVLAAALCVDVILCNGILKNLVARIRPYDVNTSIQLLVAKPTDFSFPSGHTAASFTAVTALYFAGEKKLWKGSLVLACLIAFSRMYLYVHYPTDVLGGIVIGIVAGAAGFFVVEKWRK